MDWAFSIKLAKTLGLITVPSSSDKLWTPGVACFKYLSISTKRMRSPQNCTTWSVGRKSSWMRSKPLSQKTRCNMENSSRVGYVCAFRTNKLERGFAPSVWANKNSYQQGTLVLQSAKSALSKPSSQTSLPPCSYPYFAFVLALLLPLLLLKSKFKAGPTQKNLTQAE